MTANPATTFEACFEALIGHEGGYVNHPNDPGGETNFGISRRSYPDLNIATLTLEQARAIYRRDFWDRLGLDALPPALRLQVFDAAVNSGPGNAARWLQAAAGVAQDGVIGPLTRARLGTLNTQTLGLRFNAARLRFMCSLSNWPTFGRGWALRVAANMEALA
jgi:hypothetical protein